MSWDFSTDPGFEEKLAWMRTFVREELWPLETLDLSWEQLKRAVAPLQAEVKGRGLWAAHLDPELGGQGFGQLKLGLMHEILGTSSVAPFAFGNQAPDSGNSEILALVGTPKQKELWLRPLLAGEIRSCFSMTEPDTAGSDPTLLAASAVQVGDEWILNGTKWYASNASVADVFIFVAVTDPEAARHRRATMFIVPADTPGVEIIRDVPTMEHPHDSFGVYGNHAEVELRDVRVPAESILGERGSAFLVAQHRLGPGRIHHCMRWLGQAQRAFDMLCERATYRFAHGSVLGDKGVVRTWIADSAAEIEAARLMTLKAAWRIDRDGASAARDDIAMIKYFGAGVLHNVVDRAIQVHGSLGFSTDLPLERMYRSARAARIYDGPDEVHRDSVARRVLARYTPPADGRPSEDLPARRAQAKEHFAWLLEEMTAND